MNKLNLQDEISRVEKALAVAQKRESDNKNNITNKNVIEEPDFSDDNENDTITEDVHPPVIENEVEKPIIENENEQEQEQQEVPDIKEVDEKPKSKSKSKSKSKYFQSESESESESDDEYTIEFVVNRIHDQIKFFQKNIYRLITKYKNQIFDEEELTELNDLYIEEEEDFHNSYEESIGILPTDTDLPDKFYNKFEKEVERIQNKWNSFIQRLEIVK